MNNQIKKSEKDTLILRILFVFVIAVLGLTILNRLYEFMPLWYKDLWFMFFIWPMTFINFINMKYIPSQKFYFYVFGIIGVVTTIYVIVMAFQ